MKIGKYAPLMLLVIAGCSGKSCGGCGSADSSTPQPPAPLQTVDCQTFLKPCLEAVRNTEGNLAAVNAVRDKCTMLEKKAFAFDPKDLAAIREMGKDGTKVASELRACEDIRSRGLQLMQQAVKELGPCYPDK